MPEWKEKEEKNRKLVSMREGATESASSLKRIEIAMPKMSIQPFWYNITANANDFSCWQ